MDKILSIIIPSYNMEKYLDKCVGCLMVDDRELLQKLDIIVVNDGSKDCTSEIGHAWAGRQPGIVRVIDKPNGHYGSCVNAALKVAEGTFVKMLDADDHYDTKAFESLLRSMFEMENKRPGVVDAFITDLNWVYEDGKVYQTTAYAFPKNEVVSIEDPRVKLDSIIYMHALAYRTDNLRKIAYKQTEGICFTDNEWIFEPFTQVKNIYYAPVSVYQYLNGREGQSTDRQTSIKQVWMFDRLLASLAKRYGIRASSVSDKVKDYLYFLAEDIAQYVFLMEILHNHNVESDARLSEVDEAIKNNWPRLDAYLNSFRFSHKLPVRFVSLWRRHQSSQAIGMKIFLFFAKLVAMK